MTRTIRTRHIFIGGISAFGLLANTAQAQVVCDQFEIVAELNGHNLMMSLDTDLPDGTTIMVGVSRRYYQNGSSEEYLEVYYDERSTVGKWRLPRKISVRDEIWTNVNRKKQRLFSDAAMPFKVREISDDIILSFVVPFPDIRIEEHRRVKHRSVEHRIYLPMGTSSDAVNIKTPVHAYNLKNGKKYVLEHRVPMLPRWDSVEPEDLDQIRQLLKGYVIEILEKDEQRSLYRVKATDQSGREVGSGWISHTALLNQEIWEVTGTDASDPGEPREPDNRPLVLRGETGWTRLHAGMGSAEVAKLLGAPGVKRNHDMLLFWYYPDVKGGFVMFLDGLLDSWEAPPSSTPSPPSKPTASPEASQSNATASDDRTKERVDAPTHYLYYSGGRVTVAKTSASVTELSQHQDRVHEDDFDHMYESGEWWHEWNGTTCRILQTEPQGTKIEIMSGQNEGKMAWAPTRAIKKRVATVAKRPKESPPKSMSSSSAKRVAKPKRKPKGQGIPAGTYTGTLKGEHVTSFPSRDILSKYPISRDFEVEFDDAGAPADRLKHKEGDILWVDGKSHLVEASATTFRRDNHVTAITLISGTDSVGAYEGGVILGWPARPPQRGDFVYSVTVKRTYTFADGTEGTIKDTWRGRLGRTR